MSTRKLYYARLIRFAPPSKLACVQTNRTVVAKVTASVCDYPHHDRSGVPITVTATVLTVTLIFIILRLASKQWVSGSLGWEDWIIACALLLSVVSTYFTVTFCKEGFGKHIWDLNDGDLSRILENCKFLNATHEAPLLTSTSLHQRKPVRD
jgi:uncharacterized membrane protein